MFPFALKVFWCLVFLDISDTFASEVPVAEVMSRDPQTISQNVEIERMLFAQVKLILLTL